MKRNPLVDNEKLFFKNLGFVNSFFLVLGLGGRNNQFIKKASLLRMLLFILNVNFTLKLFAFYQDQQIRFLQELLFLFQ